VSAQHWLTERHVGGNQSVDGDRVWFDVIAAKVFREPRVDDLYRVPPKIKPLPNYQ